MDHSDQHTTLSEEKMFPRKGNDTVEAGTLVESERGEIVNASGHRDQLQRQYGLVSICGLALTIDNAWVALGGSITVSIYNGGPPGILYELLVACFYYGFIGASIAEVHHLLAFALISAKVFQLASAIPSAGGVYHWASVTPGPHYGRVLGFFAGYLNFAGWIFDLASIVSIPANVVVQMYAIFHPDLTIEAWHVFVAFIIITWSCCFFVIFGNRFLPLLNKCGLFLIIVGGLVTIIVVAAMPKTHASSSFVWSEWNNQAGWPNGVTFLTGVLNGAFTIGTPDAVTHMSEELPNPRRDMPKAIAAQLLLGTISMPDPMDHHKPSELTCLSRFSLRHCYFVRYHRPRSCTRRQWLLSTSSSICPSNWKQWCNIWPAAHCLPFNHDLRPRHIPYSRAPACKSYSADMDFL
ncbi:MAG: hypothetical protein LQ347_002123 [Umbilicaria vellea]|nr:MAG: hypothetical protein LQ347_002123 [Umbilicaria vellea]